MGSGGRVLFDLNEPPAEDIEIGDGVVYQPQKAFPSSNIHTSGLLLESGSHQRITNNFAFSHASSASGFQPFVRIKSAHQPDVDEEFDKLDHHNSKIACSTNPDKDEMTPQFVSGSRESQLEDREEGEWSDAEGSADAHTASNPQDQSKNAPEQELTSVSGATVENNSLNPSSSDFITEESASLVSVESYTNHVNGKSTGSRTLELNASGEIPVDGQADFGSEKNHREVKGIEASQALKCVNNSGKRKVDQQQEAKLGKRRSRQTMFLNLEDVRQAGSMKSSTPRKQTFLPPITKSIVKEIRLTTPLIERAVEKQQASNKDIKQGDISCDESGMETGESKSDLNCDGNSDLSARHSKLNNNGDSSTDPSLPPFPRQVLGKQPTDSKQLKNAQVGSRKPVKTSPNSMEIKIASKKHLQIKKPNVVSTPHQDTSVERLIREVTNEKFWHTPEETELQCVPGRFESVEEYVRVFEPLLFEECRAQLYSTWEESTETVSRDSHVVVRIKNIERRERGWYDVIVLPVNECKWSFKEGDVAILSSQRPGSVGSKRNNTSSVEGNDEPDFSDRVSGTVRRHIPIDTRDPPGAILHFYVGDSYDSNKVDDDHLLRKLQPKGVWYLTVLGSIATTQREYIALHAFRRLNSQMQTSILQPCPEQFPRYEQQPPAMPECFTQNFVDHLHRTFNGPQLAAIQWAAMHTAAGTGSGTAKKQDPWPFTLVQGPPGTGKTHTVWGMLNVIHLVQYQHYYTSLLKKLAPESYKQANDSSLDNVMIGSIDEVLQNMDQNLFRTLPKLCPKPRMLVCAPSNAATDELLARVLDRGFIDGEMKVYRPDVARVGVDSQTRAAQAVSVERRTEQLLMKSREEILGWMHQLKGREAQFAQQISILQRELNLTAAAVRSQGSVGVDPDVLVARDQNRDTLLQSLAAAVEGRDKNFVEMSRLLILESKFRAGTNFNLEEARASLEASFANEAEIVFTTVSSSGRKLFSRLTHGFDMVVIDEAAQASEVAVLPPLSLGAARCVLVGDPQQLPATVISKAAGTLLYSRSLFERFQQAGCPTMLLSVQYRMHPQIRDFPSRYFYQGRLTDSESVANLPDEPYYKDVLLKPYIFYDITHGRESHKGGSVSYQNIHEAQFCFRLYEHLQKSLKSLGMGKVSVGIITPYKLQLKCLQRQFEDVLSTEEGKDFYINTVDAFQGQERDVIIMSCVRASGHGVGFVADIRRMNVALTRARRSLWIMGNANALVQSDDWASLISDAKGRNCYLNMDSLPTDFLVSKGPSYAALPGKISNMRGLRSTGTRHRSLDLHVESRSGTPSEDDEKSNPLVISRNGIHRPLKPPLENSLHDSDQLGDRTRDAWPHGTQKKQSFAGNGGKRET